MVMNNAPAADLTDTAASLAADEELAYLLATADRAQQERTDAPGPAEEVLCLASAAGLALRAAEATSAGARAARLTLAEQLLDDAARVLAVWRLSAGCEDWQACTWTAEVLACAECQAAVDRLTARTLRARAAQVFAAPAASERAA